MSLTNVPHIFAIGDSVGQSMRASRCVGINGQAVTIVGNPKANST